MVRQIIADLETGDHCENEKQSLYRSIEHYQNIITVKDEIIDTKDKTIKKNAEVTAEKNKQIVLLIDQVNTLRKEKGQKFWQGVYIGGGTGLALGLLILAL